ncbi:hypothetical protein ZWY2020_037987 [Hordeum vulgare]|nr:hypothetical protein ZWY2020_037987 [Hordeum vulgare]
MGPMGCVPAELAQHSDNDECAVELNRAVDLFDPQLVDMVHNVQCVRQPGGGRPYAVRVSISLADAIAKRWTGSAAVWEGSTKEGERPPAAMFEREEAIEQQAVISK